jgi:hypothetical protein
VTYTAATMAAQRRRSIRGSGRCRRAVPGVFCHPRARVNPAPAGPASVPSGGDFVSGQVTGWVVRHGPADRVPFVVLVVLADAARNDGTGVRLGNREIARRARMSLGAVSGAVRRLVAAGWIEVVETSAGNVPNEYRVVIPHGVENGARVHPGERARSPQSERARSPQSERARSPQSERAYRNTGSTGFTGTNAPPGGRRRRRVSPAAEQAAIDACPDCDERGWVFVNDRAARCDHGSAFAQGRRR